MDCNQVFDCRLMFPIEATFHFYDRQGNNCLLWRHEPNTKTRSFLTRFYQNFALIGSLLKYVVTLSRNTEPGIMIKIRYPLEQILKGPLGDCFDFYQFSGYKYDKLLPSKGLLMNELSHKC